MGCEEQKPHPAQTKRYPIRMQPDLEWTIYDVFTGEAARPSTICQWRRRTSIVIC